MAERQPFKAMECDGVATAVELAEDAPAAAMVPTRAARAFAAFGAGNINFLIRISGDVANQPARIWTSHWSGVGCSSRWVDWASANSALSLRTSSRQAAS